MISIKSLARLAGFLHLIVAARRPDGCDAAAGM